PMRVNMWKTRFIPTSSYSVISNCLLQTLLNSSCTPTVSTPFCYFFFNNEPILLHLLINILFISLLTSLPTFTYFIYFLNYFSFPSYPLTLHKTPLNQYLLIDSTSPMSSIPKSLPSSTLNVTH